MSIRNSTLGQSNNNILINNNNHDNNQNNKIEENKPKSGGLIVIKNNPNFAEIYKTNSNKVANSNDIKELKVEVGENKNVPAKKGSFFETLKGFFKAVGSGEGMKFIAQKRADYKEAKAFNARVDVLTKPFDGKGAKAPKLEDIAKLVNANTPESKAAASKLVDKMIQGFKTEAKHENAQNELIAKKLDKGPEIVDWIDIATRRLGDSVKQMKTMDEVATGLTSILENAQKGLVDKKSGDAEGLSKLIDVVTGLKTSYGTVEGLTTMVKSKFPEELTNECKDLNKFFRANSDVTNGIVSIMRNNSPDLGNLIESSFKTNAEGVPKHKDFATIQEFQGQIDTINNNEVGSNMKAQNENRARKDIGEEEKQKIENELKQQLNEINLRVSDLEGRVNVLMEGIAMQFLTDTFKQIFGEKDGGIDLTDTAKERLAGLLGTESKELLKELDNQIANSPLEFGGAGKGEAQIKFNSNNLILRRYGEVSSQIIANTGLPTNVTPEELNQIKKQLDEDPSNRLHKKILNISTTIMARAAIGMQYGNGKENEYLRDPSYIAISTQMPGMLGDTVANFL